MCCARPPRVVYMPMVEGRALKTNLLRFRVSEVGALTVPRKRSKAAAHVAPTGMLAERHRDIAEWERQSGSPSSLCAPMIAVSCDYRKHLAVAQVRSAHPVKDGGRRLSLIARQGTGLVRSPVFQTHRLSLFSNHRRVNFIPSSYSVWQVHPCSNRLANVRSGHRFVGSCGTGGQCWICEPGTRQKQIGHVYDANFFTVTYIYGADVI